MGCSFIFFWMDFMVSFDFCSIDFSVFFMVIFLFMYNIVMVLILWKINWNILNVFVLIKLCLWDDFRCFIKKCWICFVSMIMLLVELLMWWLLVLRFDWDSISFFCKFWICIIKYINNRISVVIEVNIIMGFIIFFVIVFIWLVFFWCVNWIWESSYFIR